MTTDKSLHFVQASDFTAFHRKLAVLIGPYLNPDYTAADIGCGLALLDFEIADKVKCIDAIDADGTIIENVKARIEQEYISGHHSADRIRPETCTSEDLGDRTWDIVLLSFYGTSYPALEDLIGRAKHRAIIVLHGRHTNGRFDPYEDESKKMTAEELEPFLIKGGYTFKKMIVDLQFGLPFKSIEDIHGFLSEYVTPEPEASGSDTAAADIYEKQMLSIEERIIKTDRYDYPYYLPNNFCVGIFVITK
ncbi:MAG: hypothetical protein LBN36_01695 [Clostridiales Family XIII bacterium]|jgi:hypothetical protein|nr:hypothetical protein [Clostridiales Family XIII bacterium]